MTTAVLYFLVATATSWLMRSVVPMRKRAVAALVLLPLVFTGRALLTGAVYAPIDLPYLTNPLKQYRAAQGIDDFRNGMLSDVYSLNIPWKAAVRASYSAGEWPLWNPHTFCGDILAASAQPTPYEPFFLLSLLVPLPNSLTFLAAITFFLAGLLMFAWLRELRCSEVASIVGAATWMFAGFIVFWLEWVITPTMVWLPFVLLGVRRIVRERTVRGGAILTVAFVMMLLSGHPESALHIVTVGMLWALVELSFLRFRGFPRAALLGVGAGVVALLITAMYMLPILEALPETAEHDFRQNVFAKVERSLPLAKSLDRLHSHFNPFRFGAPHREWPAEPEIAPFPESSWCGSVALAVALFGLWRSSARWRWLAFAMVVLGLILAIEIAPFADWIAKLPLYDIALNARFAAVAAFGIAMLTAAGVDALAEWKRFGFSAIFVLAALGALLWSDAAAMKAWKLSDAFVRASAMTMLVPLALALLATLVFRRRPVLIAASLLTLLVGQRAMEMADFYPTLPARMFYPELPIFANLPKSEEPYRVTGFGYALIPNTATLYGLEDVRGYQAMTFKPMYDTQALWSERQTVWFNRVEKPSPFLSMMNVRFAVAEDGYATPEGWREVARDAGAVLFENPAALPRVFIPRNVAIARDPVKEWGTRIFETSDFGRWSWVEVGEARPYTGANATGALHTRREGPNGLRVRASMDTPGWIIASQMAWKGWRAYVDGKPAKVRRSNHAFLAVYLDRGDHDVRFRYYPHSFVVGRAITMVTLVALALTAIVARRRARRIAG